MGRPKNMLEIVSVTITINTTLAKDLDRIVHTGLFGNGRSDCIARLAAESVRHLIKEGVLAKRGKDEDL